MGKIMEEWNKLIMGNEHVNVGMFVGLDIDQCRVWVMRKVVEEWVVSYFSFIDFNTVVSSVR